MSKLIAYAFILAIVLPHVSAYQGQPSIRHKAEHFVARRRLGSTLGSTWEWSDSDPVKISDKLDANEIPVLKNMEECEQSTVNSHFYIMVLPNKGCYFSSGDIKPYTFQVYASVGDGYIQRSERLLSHETWFANGDQDRDDEGLEFERVVALFRNGDDIVGIATPSDPSKTGVTCVAYPFQFESTDAVSTSTSKSMSKPQELEQVSRFDIERVFGPIHIQIMDGGATLNIIKPKEFDRNNYWLLTLRAVHKAYRTNEFHTFHSFTRTETDLTYRFEYRELALVSSAVVVMHDFDGKAVGRTEIWNPSSGQNMEYLIIGFPNVDVDISEANYVKSMDTLFAADMDRIPVFRPSFSVVEGRIVERLSAGGSLHLKVFAGKDRSQSLQQVPSPGESMWGERIDVSEFDMAVCYVKNEERILGRTEFWHPKDGIQMEYVVIQPTITRRE